MPLEWMAAKSTCLQAGVPPVQVERRIAVRDLDPEAIGSAAAGHLAIDGVVDERLLRCVARRHRVADDLSERVDPFGGGIRTERAQVDESAGRRPRDRVVARI